MRASAALLTSAGRVALARARPARAAAIAITDTAASRVKELLSSKPDAIGVRLGVKQRGCNGVSYTMNYATDRKASDEEVADKGIRVFIEPSALMKIVGTTMDWREDELAAEFVFANPNAKAVCGCGESFNV